MSDEGRRRENILMVVIVTIGAAPALVHARFALASTISLQNPLQRGNEFRWRKGERSVCALIRICYFLITRLECTLLRVKA
jgi:hypothetical protein